MDARECVLFICRDGGSSDEGSDSRASANESMVAGEAFDAVERPMVRSEGSVGNVSTVEPADVGIMVTGGARRK